MVARSPPKFQRKMVVAPPPLSPTLLRETIKKVDKCMARLQELQYTVMGEKKVISGVRLSPRSTKSYLRTSLRCKQESLRVKNAASQRSPPGKLPINTEEWQRMSLPAMILGETMGEILQATQFASNIVEAVVSSKTRKSPIIDDPRTPVPEKRKQKPILEKSELIMRRKKEKQIVLQNKRTESSSSSDDVPSVRRRTKSRINFKNGSSPVQKRDCDKENCKYIANRVSPSNRPWARKTVLFPNPLFRSSPTSQHQQKFFSKTKSPVIVRTNRQCSKTTTSTPHKFLIKSPPAASKFQVKIRNSPPFSISPTRRGRSIGKKSSSSPKGGGGSISSKLRRSFSPSRLANKLVSPLKSRKSSSVLKKNEGMKMMTTMMSGLKQRPTSLSVRFSSPRI